MRAKNPLAFRPGPVTFWTTVIYIALVIPLIWVHETVPPAPADRSLYQGLNLTEAWLDLQTISRTYHPYNSHENDRVRKFLIDRTKEILDRNDLSYTTETIGGVDWYSRTSSLENFNSFDTPEETVQAKPRGATLFDDRTSNVSWTYNTARRMGSNISKGTWLGQYFEGNNYYVYIHGTDDPEGEWWRDESKYKKFHGQGGVLVNCHFDSVSTGYGATDDGMSCVSMLQLLSYFTLKGRQPKNGIVLLFNNAEEDGLLGARAFGYSPLLHFTHTFVNLEGAGAGGRALLFRTTDLQAAKAYSKSPHPLGSVVAANAFERGVIKSATDYEIFADIFGQRGLDIAFYAPRARYHTNQDDARHTSVNSIWHMLSAALASTEHLSKTTGTIFNGDRSDGNSDLVQNGKQAEGVWFDIFGAAWAVFALRGLFAWSLTLLVATPLVLMAFTYILVRNDKYYFFARDIKMHHDINDDPVTLGGWKGFFRFPFALAFAGGVTIAATLLVAKFNPLIIYSSGYAVWSMTLSVFYFSFWLIMRGSAFVRPSALHRGFVLIWLFALGWGVQVVCAVAEDRMHIGALYATVFFQSAIFLALLISLLEQFALLGKHDFALQLHDAHQARDVSSRGTEQESRPQTDNESAQAEADDGEDEGEDATETTPLRAGESGYGSNAQTSFANTYRRSVADTSPAPPSMRRYQPFEHEQSWSGRLPTWTWILQFLFLAPIPVILFGNLGLVVMTATQMTGTDGGSLLVPVLSLGILSIFLLLPLTPFMHRVTHHVPMFLFFVFVGTLIYNLVAFPFSDNNRFKFYFQQVIDLDNGTDTVSIVGIEDYARSVISSLPSTTGQDIKCQPAVGRDLTDCQYDSSSLTPNLYKDKSPKQLVSIETVDGSNESKARIRIDAIDSRLCYVRTSRPIYGFAVDGASARDPRFGKFPSEGFSSVQLWRRDRDRPWTLNLYLNDRNALDMAESEREESEMAGDEELKARSVEQAADRLEVTVSCAWSDANTPGTIPALDELLKYMPTWAAVTKKNVGLVEVRKTHKV
ncbi:aminopeptidase y [Fusarium sporotrichioides]|uniref:Peptide hydrolase n=1 Tax=Fusarium sporotrichioides TaxID=5514 RepID=A0A395S036_FUSSP|nr:aminopeptidase y [Fusarium sporotrichioides]